MLKNSAFCIKNGINDKISEQFFCPLFFLVANMFLKTYDRVSQNGYFDYFWGGIRDGCIWMAVSEFLAQARGVKGHGSLWEVKISEWQI